MAGMTERHPSHGPKLTYQPWTSVTGGRLCEPDPGNPGYIRHASLNSTTVVGMAKNDATRKAGGPFEVSPRASTGYVVNQFTPVDVVCYDDGVFDVEVTGALAQGQRLVCDADGKFKPAVTADTGIRVARNAGPALSAADVTAGKRARVRLLPA